MSHIVAVDDRGSRNSDLLDAELVAVGYDVKVSPSLAEAAAQPDAALVVARLNGPDPARQVAKIRADLQPPLIVLIPAAETAFLTMIELYEVGVDDCMAEPLDIDRLSASISGFLDSRPAARADAVEPPPVSGPLLPIERRILAELHGQASRPLTHQQLTARVWGENRTDQDSILRVFLHLIGRKLAEPDRLVTHPQILYR